MSGKASVSKELHAKHTKILEGLVKLPDNRECADCGNKYGTTMGKCELRDIHLHAMFRNSSESWSAYITVTGNVWSNKHWEAELPPNFDRNGYGIERFIRSKYVEKRWASKGELQPASKSVEAIFNSNESPDAGTKNAIQKNRRLSLEESILVKHMIYIRPPIAKSNEAPLEVKKISPPVIRRPSASFDFDHNSRAKNNGTVDLFAMLSNRDDKKDISTTPSSWTKFDCKMIILEKAYEMILQCWMNFELHRFKDKDFNQQTLRQDISLVHISTTLALIRYIALQPEGLVNKTSNFNGIATI
ncbi:putative ADP-ribosylation factor GTPase-activating protein AGD15 [Mucuna pruriens]|uniref:ADP-ribosylation factor GTPase-activating protein AGD15 n=1 Tax=Mucuna pruriens TaxID=157652 RepID=A0A371G149_MUCPR|nr:putative ADP-ribosylation factor GTPase-activating protein AGD15 [Mucuna pruriens]